MPNMKAFLLALPLLTLLACAESPKQEHPEGNTTPAETITYDTVRSETLRVENAPIVTPIPMDSALPEDRD